jgi:DNA-binding LacI/PurR family transcriptional regulator
MTTIRDIATAAGVSPMTVSNVINKRPHVAAATRERVLEAIDHLDYRVNVAARNLRRGRTHTIGLAVPEIDRPYWGQLAAAVIEHGERLDLTVVIEQTGRSRENELNALALSRVRMYDGLILSAVGLGAADRDLLKVDYPIVILGERIFQSPVDHVAMANTDGARAAVEHLIAQGRRRIAIAHGPLVDDVDVSSLRHAGYRQALEAHGIPFDPSLVVEFETFDPASGAEAVHRLRSAGTDFDAVFCVTDYVALGVLRGLTDASLRVPEDVHVVGFDNNEFGRFVVPSLTSVDPDYDEMARRAVDLLANRIEHADAEPVELVSTFRVVPRESTGN